MLTGDVRPMTLGGIKRLAAQLRKEQGLKHSIALDLAAKAANYTNFRNAQRVLRARGEAVERPYVLLTMYWYDQKQRRSGRETLKIDLPTPILDICGKSALKNVRGFGELRLVASDHFVSDMLASTQSYARERLCTAERSLRFMEHTGLRPSRDYRKAYPRGSVKEKLPYSDHSSLWLDPAGGQVILIDEPYSNAPNDAERAVWAARNNWRVIKTSWPGMYSPHVCDLYVASDGNSNYDLDALVARINAMPAPLLETDWLGESSPSWDTFVSPMAKTKQDARRARCRGTIYPAPSATTVPYSYSLGEYRRRPAGRMSVAGHVEAGRIIKAVLHSSQRPYAVYTRMTSLRSTLEDWMALEIGREELTGQEFFEVYYTETNGDAAYRKRARSRAGVVAMLGDLKQKLKAAYPDCAPLRRQFDRIDVSVSLIDKMKRADD